MKNNRRRGFTLIELLIVIAVIAILAAIAIPNLLASRQSANEASAIGSLRTLNSAEQTYHSRLGKFGALSDLLAQKLIDPVLASATSANPKSGYGYTLTVPTGLQTYFAVAAPANAQGTRQFYTDEAGAIFADSTLTDSVSGDVSGSMSALGSNWTAIGQ